MREAVREGEIHPSQHDQTCPTCGHDPTHGPPDSSTRTLAGLDPSALNGLDAGRLRPHAVLYLHASHTEFRGGTGLVRLDNHRLALTHQEALDILGHCQVKITPVIDLNDHHPVDAYEIPTRLTDQVKLAYPTTVFPFTATSSRAHGVDLDHTTPYRPHTAGDEAGQTRLDNLAPLTRASHRVKTHAPGWTTRNPLFGVHLWRTPHGYCFQHDPTGTVPLGKMTAEEFTQLTRELAEHLTWDHDTDTHDTSTAPA